MVLKRSESARSTLSTLQRRATRYQKYLTLASVVLIITSIIVIFSSVILIKFYHLTKLHFWNPYFYVTPILLISLGVYKFIVAVYGFAITGTENRGILSVFAILLSIAFIAQLASIFMVIEVRTTIVLGEYGGTDVVKVLQKYGIDRGVTSEWDDMQTDMRCCGGIGYRDGHAGYQNTPIGQYPNFSVPDSCCMQVSPGCGRGVLKITQEQIRNRIWVTGCLDALRHRLENDVTTTMEVYAGVGVVVAIIELIAVVLTSAFIAQISRRMAREEPWTTRQPYNYSEELDQREVLNPSVEHETIC